MKKESIEEFLARGGKITKCEPAKDQSKEEVIKSTLPKTIDILSYDDADLFYGKVPERKKPLKKKPDMDLSALPDHLKSIFVKDLSSKIEEAKYEESEVEDGEQE